MKLPVGFDRDDELFFDADEILTALNAGVHREGVVPVQTEVDHEADRRSK